MKIVLFEDQQADLLYPITLSRPAYAIPCGGFRLVDLALQSGLPVQGIVRDYLDQRQRDYLPKFEIPASESSNKEKTLLVNARLVPYAHAWDRLLDYAQAADEIAFFQGDQLLAAVIPADRTPDRSDRDAWQNCIRQQSAHSATDALPGDLRLIEYPHQIVAHHEAILSSNLHKIIERGSFEVREPGVFVSQDVVLPRFVEFDAVAGPIVIEQGVQIGPFSYLKGPLLIGHSTKISPQSVLKGNVAVGHTAKLGGEVGSSIIDCYSNKAHYGYLGHSFVGSWVNLGAGTSCSNLKNTYGTIRVACGTEQLDTKRQFIGCVVGDFTKTAINTSIFTGKTLGACSNVYGFVTTDVDSFANYARSFGQLTRMPVEVMAATQKRVFARRGIEQRPCDVQLLHDMFKVCTAERTLPLQPLAL